MQIYFFSGQCINGSRIIYDSLEDHKLICMPTMIDESNAPITEVKIIDDEVLLVAKTRSRSSCNLKIYNHSRYKSQKCSKSNKKAETKVETQLIECQE